MRLTRLGDSLFRVSFDNDRLVGLSVDESVVDNLNAGVVGWQLGDFVCNGLSFGESWDVLPDIGKIHHEVLLIGSAELGLGLLAEDHNIGTRLIDHHPSCSLAQAGVDASAETLIRTSHDEQGLLVFEGFGFGVLEHSIGGLTVGSRIGHGSLGLVETSGSNNLHGLGDFLDVLDGLQPALDFTEGREICGIGRGGIPFLCKITASVNPVSSQC